MSRNLRRLPRISYYEVEDPDWDEYVYCDECGDYVYEYCAIHGPLLVLPDDKVPSPTGFPSFVPRAALTIPHEFLHLAHSTIPDAGLGVFATLTLPKGVRFGPYRGEKTQDPSSEYCWQIYHGSNRRPVHVVDAQDANRSNWMRYVNCSRHCSEQNLVAYQYQGELYYRTIKIVPRMSELLVFYGAEFARALRVNLKHYNTVQGYMMLTYTQHQGAICNAKPESKNNEPSKTLIDNQHTAERSTIDMESDVLPTTSNDTKTKTKTGNIKLKVPGKKETMRKSKGMSAATNMLTDNHQTTGQTAIDMGSDVLPTTSNDIKFKTVGVKCKAKKDSTKKSKEMGATNNMLTDNYQTTGQTAMDIDSDVLPTTSNDIKFKTVDVKSKAKNDSTKKCKEMGATNNMLTDNHQTTGQTAIDMDSEVLLTTSNDIKFKTVDVKCKTKKDSTKIFKEMGATNNMLTDNHQTTGIIIDMDLDELPTTSNDIKHKTADIKRKTKNNTAKKSKEIGATTKNVLTDKKSTQEENNNTLLYSGKESYSCNICNYKTYAESKLKSHSSAHTAAVNFSCDSCSYITTNKGSLIIHLRTHTGEKCYSCEICHKKFTTKSYLSIHTRIHTGEKLYSCNTCGKKFTHLSNLQTHTRIHTGEKPYSCKVCHKKFTRKHHLHDHIIRIHTGEKPYSCNTCDKKFTDQRNLHRHTRIHTGEKPYSCNTCHKTFIQKGHLDTHIRIHTGEKPYACEICNENFAHKRTYNNHIMMHTGKKSYLKNTHLV